MPIHAMLTVADVATLDDPYVTATLVTSHFADWVAAAETSGVDMYDLDGGSWADVQSALEDRSSVLGPWTVFTHYLGGDTIIVAGGRDVAQARFAVEFGYEYESETNFFGDDDFGASGPIWSMAETPLTVEPDPAAYGTKPDGTPRCTIWR